MGSFWVSYSTAEVARARKNSRKNKKWRGGCHLNFLFFLSDVTIL